jgi:signal transduction histidine kinase
MTASPDFNPEVEALKQQLQRTQLAYQMASEMSQFKAGFLARVAHELRSPLNSIIGMHQLILSDLCEDAAEEREFVAQANTGALKLVGLMDEIINVSRTEYGTNNLQIQPLQLSEILAEVYQQTHLQAANRNLQLTIESINPAIYILADSRWLRQVLVNLVDSPLKVMQEGSICVSVNREPNSELIQICVEDQRPASNWSEPIDLLKLDPNHEKPADIDWKLSPGMTLLINQTILELMKGRLEILAVPSVDEATPITRIACSIPLVIKENFA